MPLRGRPRLTSRAMPEVVLKSERIQGNARRDLEDQAWIAVTRMIKRKKENTEADFKESKMKLEVRLTESRTSINL